MTIGEPVQITFQNFRRYIVIREKAAMMVAGHKTRSVFDRSYIVVTLRDAANKTSYFQAHLHCSPKEPQSKQKP